MQKHLQNVLNLNGSRKAKECKFPLMASVQKLVQNVFAKIVPSACFVIGFPIAIKC